MASPSPTTFISWLDLYDHKRFNPGTLKIIEKEIYIFDTMWELILVPRLDINM
jgi:hypothetical protein